MYRLIRRLLFLIPAETAHRLGIWVLRVLGLSKPLCRTLRARAAPRHVDLSVSFAGLTFPNPLGLAAGLDKNAEAVDGLFALGFGAVEIGTFTPLAQDGNPRPRLFRLPADQALINRLGFNNCGADVAAARLARRSWRPAPLGINIGKGQGTPIDGAIADYLRCIEILAPLSDYVAINASSPNTPGLRTLQDPERLENLLPPIRQRLTQLRRALFLKISPDLTPEAVDQLVEITVRHQVDGLIATNTTVGRPIQDRRSQEEGGLSGAPLRPLANQVIHRAYQRAQGRLAIIGVGGVFSARDLYEKLQAGASLVQVYTGLVYQGPTIVRSILSGLTKLLEQNGHRSPAEVVGTSALSHSPLPQGEG